MMGGRRFIIVAVCVLGLTGFASCFPMELPQNAVEPDEPDGNGSHHSNAEGLSNDEVAADNSASDSSEEKGGGDSNSADEPDGQQTKESARQSKQLFLSAAPIAYHPSAAALLAPAGGVAVPPTHFASNRRLKYQLPTFRRQQDFQQAFLGSSPASGLARAGLDAPGASEMPYRMIGGASALNGLGAAGSSAHQQHSPAAGASALLGASSSPQLRTFWINRNQLIDGIINALELLRGGFRGSGSSSSSSSHQASASSSNNANKRIQLASDDVNKALTIIGNPAADQVMHVPNPAGGNGGSSSSPQNTPSEDDLDLEIQALIDDANRVSSSSSNTNRISSPNGLSQPSPVSNGRPVFSNDLADVYESQVILGSLAPERPAQPFQGLTSFSNNLPSFQIPSVSQSLQSLGNLLRLPVRVVNGWLVQ